jgi:hypothetical protein
LSESGCPGFKDLHDELDKKSKIKNYNFLSESGYPEFKDLQDEIDK